MSTRSRSNKSAVQVDETDHAQGELEHENATQDKYHNIETERKGISGQTEGTHPPLEVALNAHANNEQTDLVDSIAEIFMRNKNNDIYIMKAAQSEKEILKAVSWSPEIGLPTAARSGAGSDSEVRDINIKHGSFCKTRQEPGKKKQPREKSSKAWFELPTQEITEEVKTDLRVLRLRSAYDPKHFYRKFDDTKFPKQFQFGTVVESASDFYSSRLTKKERKQTMAEEIMHDPYLSSIRRKRYNRIQEDKSQSAKRSHVRKTENARLKKKPKKPKH